MKDQHRLRWAMGPAICLYTLASACAGVHVDAPNNLRHDEAAWLSSFREEIFEHEPEQIAEMTLVFLHEQTQVYLARTRSPENENCIDEEHHEGALGFPGVPRRTTCPQMSGQGSYWGAIVVSNVLQEARFLRLAFWEGTHFEIAVHDDVIELGAQLRDRFQKHFFDRRCLRRLAVSAIGREHYGVNAYHQSFRGTLVFVQPSEQSSVEGEIGFDWTPNRWTEFRPPMAYEEGRFFNLEELRSRAAPLPTGEDFAAGQFSVDFVTPANQSPSAVVQDNKLYFFTSSSEDIELWARPIFEGDDEDERGPWQRVSAEEVLERRTILGEERVLVFVQPRCRHGHEDFLHIRQGRFSTFFGDAPSNP